MSYSCKILLDSISEAGKRITTFEIIFPRIVLAEFNTHRMFSRNSASSRAIPIQKQMDRIQENPFIPEQFPINCSGMQPQQYITQDHVDYKNYRRRWLDILDHILEEVYYLTQEDFNVHKQIASRLLEPFMWHTVICTATEFDNFFKLRCNENAQYEIRRIANLMYDAYHAFDDQWVNASIEVNGINKEWQAIRPQKLKIGEWHTPLIYEKDNELIKNYLDNNINDNREALNFAGSTNKLSAFIEAKKKISVARCARISYLTHDGKRDIEKDLELFERLRTSGHFSPFEHVCTPSFTNGEGIRDSILLHRVLDNNGNIRNANLWGWKQMRQDLPNENCTYFRKEEK